MNSKNTIRIGFDEEGKVILEVKILYRIFKDDEVFIVECPALNITTQGETEILAKEAINDAIKLFFDYWFIEKHDLSSALKILGWVQSDGSHMSKAINNISTQDQVRQTKYQLAFA